MIFEEIDEKELDDIRSDEAEIDEPILEDETDDDTSESDDSDAGAALDDDEEEGDQASLEELVAQRAAGRKAADETEDDSDDIMALASEPIEPVGEPLPTTVVPISEQKEFVCKSCYLVKPRVQLADAERGYCRDCV